MKTFVVSLFYLAAILLLTGSVNAQVDDICAEAGHRPSFNPPAAQIPYVYGKITVKGANSNEKPPDVAITFIQSQVGASKWRVGSSGNYCFRVRSNGGVLLIEVNGIEVTRKTLPAFAASQMREDFEIVTSPVKSVAPGVISAKFYHPPNPKTTELYDQTVEAEKSKNSAKEIELLNQIVSIDPADFLGWAKLGTLYFRMTDLKEAEESFRKSLEIKPEFSPAWVNMAMIRIQQKQFEAATLILQHTLTLEPKSANIYRLLGETYLKNKQGSLGVEALNKAIELDPIGMADCHLQLAHLYQLAKANKMATKEYKLFLEKVPDYKDKKKLEEFITKNPE